MPLDIFLETDELKSLTKKSVRPAQVKVLKAMGIEHRVRPDGSIAVLRAHIIKVFDGSADPSKSSNKVVEPNWSAM